jgi:hypothetical protein
VPTTQAATEWSSTDEIAQAAALLFGARRPSTPPAPSRPPVHRDRPGPAAERKPRSLRLVPDAPATVDVPLNRCGRPRTPATMPGYRKGEAPVTKGRRYPPDPVTAEDVDAMLKHLDKPTCKYENRNGELSRLRLRALIALLWRSGLRIAEALDLELRAFGANPNDADIASELALLYLRVTPAEPERARGLALHAIRLQSGRHTGATRVEPWLTFAVASALTGRVSDATQALYVALALAPSVERVCRAAQGALSAYGERVREPVEATLYRLRMQGRDEASPYCEMPAGWVSRYRYQ